MKKHPILKKARSDFGPGVLDDSDDVSEKKTLKPNENNFCLHLKGNNLILKQNHKYFYQIQGQLSIANKNWCDLIIRRTNPYDIVIVRIIKDSQL